MTAALCLERFMKQSGARYAKLSADLIGRWAVDARYQGDKNIKTQVALARRTATMLGKSMVNISNLRSEQDLAIKSGASALREFADELEKIACWAKAFEQFSDQERINECNAALDCLAAERWGDDALTFAFELQIMSELETIDGKMVFSEWFKNQRFKSLEPDNSQWVHLPFDLCGLDLKKLEKICQRDLAKVIQSGVRAHRTISFNNLHIHCSWQDYEAYLDYRKSVSAAVEKIIGMANA